MSKLVIVESPSKAKSIQKYLGKDYTVVSSKGHIRYLAIDLTAVYILLHLNRIGGIGKAQSTDERRGTLVAIVPLIGETLTGGLDGNRYLFAVVYSRLPKTWLVHMNFTTSSFTILLITDSLRKRYFSWRRRLSIRMTTRP